MEPIARLLGPPGWTTANALTLHQARTQGVSLDVSQDHQQVPVLLNREGLEPSLPDMPRGVVVTLVPANVSGQQPVHPGSQVAIGQGPKGQVEMIGHQAVG